MFEEASGFATIVHSPSLHIPLTATIFFCFTSLSLSLSLSLSRTSIHASASDMAVYISEFEQPFLEHTRAYYRRESRAFLSYNDCVSYMIKAVRQHASAVCCVVGCMCTASLTPPSAPSLCRRHD